MTLASKLRDLPALKDFTDAELQMLQTAVAVRQYAPGALLCKQGTPGVSCFVLVEGQVEVLRESNDESRVLATMLAGTFVGQISLVDRGPRSATVRARTAVVALELSRDVFESLLRACSPLALRFQDQIALAGIRQLRSATDRLGAALQVRLSLQPKAPRNETLAYIQTAATEWGLALDDVDAAKAVQLDGIPSSAERAARRGR